MTRYFIIVASHDHVLLGVKEGIAQAGHGRRNFISQPALGDWIVYYSSKDKFEQGKAYQKFTAIGKIADENPFHPATGSAKPYRRKVHYEKCVEADIRTLIPELHFVTNKKRWGFYLMSGFKEISQDDFDIIRTAMHAH